MSIQISITVKDSYSLNTGKPEIKHKFVISPSSHNELVLAFNKAISILFPSCTYGDGLFSLKVNYIIS